ncbi:MAG: hypothetical protein JXR63_08320, partial [Spirochaetales bacterium]|nr:hypothetical protein [Spirochaetales bacterium]
ELDLKIEFFKCDENNKLFQFVYENNYYKISYENILNIAWILFDDESVIEDLGKRNYTIIRTHEDFNFLYKYISADLEQYVEDILIAIESNSSEDEDAILELLNWCESDEECDNSILSFELKKAIIIKQSCIYKNIDDLNNKELWEICFENHKIKASWENILKYFEYKDSLLDDALVHNLNDINFSRELSSYMLYDIESSDEDLLFALSSSIIKSERIQLGAFDSLICSFDSYNHIELSQVNEGKIDCLLANGRFNVTKEMVEEFKENYPEKLVLLLSSKIDDFLDIFNDCSYLLEEIDYENLFESEAISDENKKNLLKKERIYIDDNSSLHLKVKDFIRKIGNLDDFDDSCVIYMNLYNLLPVNRYILDLLSTLYDEDYVEDEVEVEVEDEEECSELELFFIKNAEAIWKQFEELQLNEEELYLLFKHFKEDKFKVDFLKKINKSSLTTDSSLVKSIVSFLEDQDEEGTEIELKIADIAKIISNLSDAEQKMIVLTSQINSLSAEQICDILNDLGDPYSRLTSQKTAKIEFSQERRRFLEKMQSNDYLNFTESNNRLNISRLDLLRNLVTVDEV